MLKKRTIYTSFIILLFSIGTFVYFEGILSNITITSLSDFYESKDVLFPEMENTPVIIAPPDVVTQTPGDYKTIAYFTQDNIITVGGIDSCFEWEIYEDIKNDPSNFIYVDFMQYNDSTVPTRYWHPLDTYDILWSSARVNSHYVPSIIFSPVYDADTYIQGNVYFMCGGDVWYSTTSEWYLKFTLESYNPTTQQADFITSVTGEFDDTDENPYGSWDGSTWDGWVYEATIPETTLIPAGNRLRTTIECMLTSTSYTGPSERIEVRTGQATYPTEWTIDSTNDTYDNYYRIQNSLESIGMQILMYQDNFPTIDLTGLENNTIYSTPTDGTITVSSDSVLSRYRWDTGGYTTFDTQQVVSVPQTTGWHTLIIQAYDFFDNLAQATYTIGYDTTLTNVILHNPANNSIVTDGQLLNFSIYDYISATYEWDKNGTEIPFLDPFDIYPYEGFENTHQLTIKIIDNLGTQYHEYVFDFDNTAPEILLVNVLNETTQPQLKNIDLIIDDRSYPLNVVYKWDNDLYSTWLPILGNLYRTYLPAIAGWHNLTVLANDSLGNSISEVYSFNTSLTLLNVDLYNLVNASYYQGGNTVEVAITNDNGTVIYFWGNDPWTSGTVIDGIMTLSGADALSSTPGTYFLTIIVGNTLNEQFEFRFIFYVDQEAPTLVQTIPTPDYNGSRFLDSAILSFTIDDNWTENEDLIILYSFDSGTELTLQLPYQIYLYGLIDGSHNLTIVVTDIAGNYYRYYIEFFIDTTSPSVGVTITDQAIVDNFRYIPANTLVIVSITDADPIIYSYYKWNSTDYLPFTDSFTLPAIEGYARLDILANDSLGNYRTRTYWLTIDASPPTIDLLLIENHTKINEITPISFHFEDINDNTIAYMEYQWDLDSSSSVKTTTEFNVSLRFDHQYETSAIIYLYTYDVVGNEYACEYEFILDFEAPTYNLLSTTNESYITGGEIIDFDVPSLDINKFLYKWDDAEDYSQILDPWDIMAPIVDGIHTLYIRLEDDTGLGLYPNYLEAVFIFIIDDIEIIYMEPEDLSSNYYCVMNYGDQFDFSVNIRDRLNQTEIVGLSYDIIREHPDINLTIDSSQYNTTVYNFTIHASNITNDAFTYIDFEFYQFTENRQLIRIYVKVNRDEGHIVINSITDEVTYEDNIILTFQLNEDTNTTALEVIYFRINGNDQDITYELIDAINYIYQITFDSEQFFSGKGEVLIELYVESTFYYGVKNDASLISITLLPIDISLFISVSNNEIIYGSDLVLYANLTRLNSIPIIGAEITFTITVYYLDGHFEVFNRTDQTNLQGIASISFTITEEMDYIIVSVSYSGNQYYDGTSTLYSENIIAIKPPGGLDLKYILIIVGGAAILIIIISIVVARVVREKPFDQLMEKITEVDISENMVKMSPGVILSIFDQTKGPIPLITNQSFDNEKYSRRMRIGTENFLLKISDQAYSSLGFEEHDERRRIGSINLPNEDMIGFIHGIQLENKAVRGGMENLSLIVLADVEYGGFLLANQEYMFPEIDDLIFALRAKKSLPEIEENLALIRRKSIIIMITASKNQKKDNKNLEQYK